MQGSSVLVMFDAMIVTHKSEISAVIPTPPMETEAVNALDTNLLYFHQFAHFDDIPATKPQ